MILSRSVLRATALLVCASPAIAQRTVDTLVTVDTVRAPVRMDARPSQDGRGTSIFQRLRPAEALGLIELGAYGQGVAPATSGGSSSLGGGGRVGLLLPFGFEAELDGSYGRLSTPYPNGSRSPYAALATRLLSNWDFGNSSSMYFGGGVVRGRFQDRYSTGGSAILGYRVGEAVAFRVDAVANFMPKPATTDLGFRAGISLNWGHPWQPEGDGRVFAAAPVTVTRTMIITRVDTVVVAASPVIESSAGSVALPPDRARPDGTRPDRTASAPGTNAIRAAGSDGMRRTSGAPVGAPALTIHFGFNRASLTPQARTGLRRAASRARTDTTLRISIAGFADQCGTDAKKEAISQARARAVEQFLVREVGIEANRVATSARGTEPLIVERRTPDGKLPSRPRAQCEAAANRRVEVRTGAATTSVGSTPEP